MLLHRALWAELLGRTFAFSLENKMWLVEKSQLHLQLLFVADTISLLATSH